MGFKFRNVAAAVAAVAALAAGSAQAALTVNNWTLNLAGVDGLPANTKVEGIGQIQFGGIAYSPIATTVGEQNRSMGLLSATSFYRQNGSTIFNTGGLNSAGGYQMTFTFDVVNEVTSAGLINTPDGPQFVTTFTHLDAATGKAANPASTGLLNIYIDAFANGGTPVEQATGAGYGEGVLIASFRVLAGNGGTFNLATGNGTDDARFEWVSGLSGVILDASGKDIANGELIAVTASQFDIDKDNDGTADVTCPTNDALAGAGATSGAIGCAQEDGRASLQQEVPEPATLALTGLALAGLGLARRRSARK